MQSVLDVPRNQPLKFCKNRVSNSWEKFVVVVGWGGGGGGVVQTSFRVHQDMVVMIIVVYTSLTWSLVTRAGSRPPRAKLGRTRLAALASNTLIGEAMAGSKVIRGPISTMPRNMSDSWTALWLLLDIKDRDFPREVSLLHPSPPLKTEQNK